MLSIKRRNLLRAMCEDGVAFDMGRAGVILGPMGDRAEKWHRRGDLGVRPQNLPDPKKRLRPGEVDAFIKASSDGMAAGEGILNALRAQNVKGVLEQATAVTQSLADLFAALRIPQMKVSLEAAVGALQEHPALREKKQPPSEPGGVV